MKNRVCGIIDLREDGSSIERKVPAVRGTQYDLLDSLSLPGGMREVKRIPGWDGLSNMCWVTGSLDAVLLLRSICWELCAT